MPNSKNVILRLNTVIIALIVGAVAVFPFIGLSTPSHAAELVDRIVAVVNSDIITLKQLDAAFKPYAEQIRKQGYSPEKETQALYKARMKLLDNMIDDKLADQEIQKEGLDVSQSEIDAAIEQIKSQNYYTDEDLRHALQMQGLTLKEYRKEIKKQILRSKLVSIKVKSSIVITESDIKAYYDAHPEKFGGQLKYQLSNIFMAVPDFADTAQTQKVRQKMTDVLDQLNKGAAFAEMAKQYSEGSNAKDGGKLGGFAMDDIAKDLRPVIEKLKPGQFSDIVSTAKGFQIFYLNGIEKEKSRSLKDVSDEIRKTLFNQEVDQKFTSWLQSLRENAHIKIIR